MRMYEEYQPFARKFKEAYRITAIFGLACVAISGVFLVGHPPPPPPANFTLFGLSIAALLLLHGGRDLARQTKDLSPVGRFLRQRLNDWFPAWMFWMQYIYALILFAIVWNALAELGFGGRRWHQVLLINVIVLHGARRWIHEYFRVRPGFGGERADEALRLWYVAAAACAAGGLISSVFFPPETRMTSEIPYALIMVWIPIVLLILAQVLMLLDRLMRPRK